MANEQEVPCPCIFSNATKNVSQRIDAEKIIQASQKQERFAKQFRIVPQTSADWEDVRASKRSLEQIIVKEPISSGVFPTVKFNYISFDGERVRPQENIFSEVFKGIGNIAVVFMPGAYTPTCTGMHLPSFMNQTILESLKTAGIDIILIVTPDTQDVTCRWVRDTASLHGLQHLVPNFLPENDVNNKLVLNLKMPIIIPYSDKGLELINMHGLVINNRLGFTSGRAYGIYGKDNALKLFVKAENPSAEKCIPVLARAILERVQSLNLKQAPAPELQTEQLIRATR